MSKKKPVNVTATAIAERAGCSRQLVSRLLARGFSEEMIVTRIKEGKAKEAARAASGNGSPVNGFPVTPWPTFAQSEARKEHLLAELRDLQLMRQRGELIPVAYVRLWGVNFLTEARDVLLRGPGELADPLAATDDPHKCEEIVRRWVERSMERFFQLERLWGQGGDAA